MNPTNSVATVVPTVEYLNDLNAKRSALPCRTNGFVTKTFPLDGRIRPPRDDEAAVERGGGGGER